MAQSRLEKIGSIYSRMKSLLDKRGILDKDKPLWFDVYEAFPPKYEPVYDRPIVAKEIRPLFYLEDKIRMKFQKDYGQYIYFNGNSKEISSTETFIQIYAKLADEYNSESEHYKAAVEEFARVNEFFNYCRQNKIKNDVKKYVAGISMVKEERDKSIAQTKLLLKRHEDESYDIDDPNEIKEEKSKDKFDLLEFLQSSDESNKNNSNKTN